MTTGNKEHGGRCRHHHRTQSANAWKGLQPSSLINECQEKQNEGDYLVTRRLERHSNQERCECVGFVWILNANKPTAKECVTQF